MPLDTHTKEFAATAVLQYFQGEHREMLAILTGSVVFVLASALLFFLARDGFAKALMVSVLLSAALLSATAGSLLVRDGKLRAALTSAIESAHPEPALQGEQTRISEVISKYRIYRYAAVLMGVLAFAALLFSRQGWLHGLAAGLLLLVVAQVAIDHYSERRAGRYLESLAGLRLS